MQKSNEKENEKKELVARRYLLLLVFYLQEKMVKIHLNRMAIKFPILKNDLHL